MHKSCHRYQNCSVIERQTPSFLSSAALYSFCDQLLIEIYYLEPGLFAPTPPVPRNEIDNVYN